MVCKNPIKKNYTFAHFIYLADVKLWCKTDVKR